MGSRESRPAVTGAPSRRGIGYAGADVVDGLERTRGVVVALLIVGCGVPPEQLAGSGPDLEPTTGTGGSTTAPTAEASATTELSDHGETTAAVDPTTTATPLDDTGSTSEAPGGSSTTGEEEDCHPLLVEVFYDPANSEDMEQWVKLFNPCAMAVDMGEYSLGWAGSDYTYGTLDLEGMLLPNRCFIVGGPVSNADNAMPTLHQAVDLNPDLIKHHDPGNGVALFLGAAGSIMPDTMPLDAVIYGANNDNDLLDANGDTPPPHVGDAGDRRTIRRTGDRLDWIIEDEPMPNVCPPS